MMATPPPIVRLGATLVAGFCAVTPTLAQDLPERGVFVTQIGDSGRITVTQSNSESRARIAQDGDDNVVELDQQGSAPHAAQIAQDGDDNSADVEQDGEGSSDIALAQDGNDNSAQVLQRETAAAGTTAATIVQRGNGNRLILAQDGSDNQAALSQTGDDNLMTATQEGAGNRLAWSQDGTALSDLQIVQTGGGNLQITQSNTGAQFAPPPGSGGK
jgi:hypothetical protein